MINDAQSISIVIMVMFFAICMISSSKTHLILFILYLSNTVLHFVMQSTPAWSAWWPAAYSLIDLIAFISIINLGDVSKKLNIWCLSGLITLHTMLAIDLITESSVVFNIYYPSVMTLISIQIIGSIFNAAGRLRRDNSRSHSSIKHGVYVKSNHQGSKA